MQTQILDFSGLFLNRILVLRGFKIWRFVECLESFELVKTKVSGSKGIEGSTSQHLKTRMLSAIGIMIATFRYRERQMLDLVGVQDFWRDSFFRSHFFSWLLCRPTDLECLSCTGSHRSKGASPSTAWGVNPSSWTAAWLWRLCVAFHRPRIKVFWDSPSVFSAYVCVCMVAVISLEWIKNDVDFVVCTSAHVDMGEWLSDWVIEWLVGGCIDCIDQE